MRNILLAALATLLFMPASAQALDIKNVRTLAGPFGSVRPGTRFLPGDILLITYDISGVKVEPATGAVRYTITMEIVDSKKKTLFKKDTPTEVIATLGGDQIPGQATVTLGADQAPGIYQVKLKVEDKISKDSKEVTYNFELVPTSFGIIQPVAPAVGFVGQETAFQIMLVGWARDAKKQPNIEVTTKITDDKGKMTLAKPLVVSLPKDLPEELKEAILKNEFVQLPLPVYLNRPGRFTVDVEAVDLIGKKTAKMKFFITVLDVNAGGR